MYDLRNKFHKFVLKTYISERGERYLDPIRHTFVKITPEETVRQKMIVFLREQLSIPSKYIRIEDI